MPDSTAPPSPMMLSVGGLIVEDGVGELVEIPVWTRRKAVASS
jgi:hypothetical protein